MIFIPLFTLLYTNHPTTKLQTSVITIIYGREVIRTIGVRYEVFYSGASARVKTEFVEHICGRCQGDVSSNCERRVRKR